MASSETAASNKAFMTIWAGELISVIGTGLTAFSLAVWVYQRTGSATLFALITLAGTLPGIVVSPIAGTLVDRWSKRWTMILADAGGGLCALALVVLIWTGTLEIWHMYILLGFSSICNAFLEPAYQVAATVLVPPEHYARASGLIQAGNGSRYVISPVLAGILIGLIGIHGTILIDFITFLVALVALSIVRIPNPKPTEVGSAGRGSVWGELSYFLKYLWERPGLLGTVVVLAVGNFGVGIMSVLAGPMILSFTSETVLGIMMSVAGSGMFIGITVLSITEGPKRLVRGMVLSMLAAGIGIAFMGISINTILITAACFVFFFCMPFVQGCHQTLLRRKVVPDMQGRMFGSSRTIMMVITELAYLVAGPLADYVFNPLLAEGGSLAGSVGRFIGVGPGRGIGLLFIIAGASIVLVALVGYLAPRVRRVEAELPDVVEEAMPAAPALAVAAG